MLFLYSGVCQRVFRSGQRGTSDYAVGYPGPAARLVQRARLGRATETVVHGFNVIETEHVPGAEPRARPGRPGLGPGRDPGGRVRRVDARGQP